MIVRQRKERVLAQVCLGEFLRNPDKRAHSAINSKRVDALVCDDDFLPLVAIEIDGNGHNMPGLADTMMKARSCLVQCRCGPDLHSGQMG